MKTYNALSKSFTDEVKTIMGGGKSIDDAFEDVKSAIIDNNFGEPTPTPEPTIYEYVDLGLPSGTMWATCNVGATKPEEYGLLFQFGRVDGYAYGDSNNQFRTEYQNTEDTGNSYIPLTTSGRTYDKNETLNLEDDAAHVNMGGKWRMPTKDELQELLDNASHEITTVNSVQGMMFTSNINNKQLFIPCSGYYNGNNFDGVRSFTHMWSSQVAASNVFLANTLSFAFNGVINIYVDPRNSAFSVRGVFKK